MDSNDNNMDSEDNNMDSDDNIMDSVDTNMDSDVTDYSDNEFAGMEIPSEESNASDESSTYFEDSDFDISSSGSEEDNSNPIVPHYLLMDQRRQDLLELREERRYERASLRSVEALEPDNAIQQPARSVINQQASTSGITGKRSGSSIVHQPSNSAMLQECRQDEDDIFSCPICLDSLTCAGEHRPACLKCGHIFGEHCIHKWIKNAINKDGRKCPTCNATTCLKDIRILYAKNLVAVDTTELTAVQRQLESVRLQVLKSCRENNELKTIVEDFTTKNALLREEVKKLDNLVESLKKGQPSTTSPNSPRKCLKIICLSKKPSCRVMAFNKNNMLLAVSQNSESQLFNKSHVIRKVNASILEVSRECIYAHKKQIRDMAFHPVEHNLLASVGLDKCVSLSDMMANIVAASLEVDEPLWSCCWAGDNSNLLIAGGQGGSVYYIDRRYMKKTLTIDVRTPACVSLVTLPPSRSRSFIRGGFLKARMDVLSVFENHFQENPWYKESKLSLRGLWSSACFDSQSNFILSTAKPCGNKKSIRHIVSKITDYDYNKSTGESIVPVATFYGGDKATLLSRSCLVPSNKSFEDTLACSYDEKTNAVKLFSINMVKNIHNFYVKEAVLDLCSLDDVMIEGRRTLASLSETSISIFSV